MRSEEPDYSNGVPDDFAAQCPVGKKNIYVCDTCRGHIVTVDIDAGVTPFIVSRCRSTPGCEGKMTSSLYRVFDQTMRADFEWYRPPAAQQISDGERQHVRKGGLLLREVSRSDER